MKCIFLNSACDFSALFDSLCKMTLLQLLTIDPALGRLDYDSLPDQTLMEMLFDGLSDDSKSAFHDSDGNFKDVCEWTPYDFPSDGINCADDHVWRIVFNRGKKFGTQQFPFNFIPPHVNVFILSSAGLHGTLDTSLLPLHLDVFAVDENALYGTLAWSILPRELEEICVSTNFFSGRIILADLPRFLENFYACHNKFSGEIVIQDLPERIMKVTLNHNMLEGSINTAGWPETISSLYLNDNFFSGDVILKDIYDWLSWVDFKNNPVSGTVVLPAYLEELDFGLSGDRITIVLDENGKRHPLDAEIRALYSKG